MNFANNGSMICIVLHGEAASAFSEGFADLLNDKAEITVLPDSLLDEADKQTYAAADVIVGVKFNTTLPRPEMLKLLHMPGAGFEGQREDRKLCASDKIGLHTTSYSFRR